MNGTVLNNSRVYRRGATRNSSYDEYVNTKVRVKSKLGVSRISLTLKLPVSKGRSLVTIEISSEDFLTLFDAMARSHRAAALPAMTNILASQLATATDVLALPDWIATETSLVKWSDSHPPEFAKKSLQEFLDETDREKILLRSLRSQMEEAGEE